MNLEDIKAVYFVGAGGIGMSALVRFFLAKGYKVGGYDKTPSPLTERLIHYDDNIDEVDDCFKQKDEVLVVYTPAIPDDHQELQYFRTNGFEVQKRAQVLGTLTKSLKGLCVAGTHGKTTTSTMAAHLLHQSHVDCNAFLGGISKNYGTNYILSESEYVVIEADIYGTKEAYLESFRKYTTLIQKGGALIIHKGLEMQPDVQEGVTIYEYSRSEGDFHAENIRIGGGEIVFDFVHPGGVVRDIQLGVPVSINIDNGIAAMALAILNGATEDELREGMKTFAGVDRRFDFKVKNDRMVFLSDYAHHPNEIAASVRSVREIYADKKIAAIFQPHLYTRTRDFYREFADALSGLDAVYLCDIYPARELPIPGVTSRLIYDNLRPGVERHLITKADILDVARKADFDVLVSLGAGDIEDYVPQITEILSAK